MMGIDTQPAESFAKQIGCNFDRWNGPAVGFRGWGWNPFQGLANTSAGRSARSSRFFQSLANWGLPHAS